ncbi:hypothetical protein NRIC_06550 [Enterococcus florum]|uniref:Uncharacterized protein n=1 Tax=Enterococcus florum TaxID=2480627 RepID=A0A4P5P8Z3_9ENTE|nr:hypothetical protein NRIC_06550 [Enterococcus florum]
MSFEINKRPQYFGPQKGKEEGTYPNAFTNRRSLDLNQAAA